MPKAPTGPKKPAPPKSTKLPRKLPDDPIAREQRLWDVGDIVKLIEECEAASAQVA